MKQEEKDLLLQDLCARLPYGVKVKITSNDSKNRIVDLTEDNICHLPNGWWSECKPYLFPLSSMTEEQKEEIDDKLIFPSNSDGGWIEILYKDKYEIPFWFIDFCNKNHLDYRGLIPMGLAEDATGKNIY